MINTKKVLLYIFIVLIPLTAAISSVRLASRDTGEVKGVSDTLESECTPYIENMIPNVAYVGEEYYFFPRVVGCSIEEVELEVRGAEWLSVMEGNYLYGIPTYTDIGTSKIEINAKSTTSSFELVDYILIKGYE